jgi:hypothetical protein
MTNIDAVGAGVPLGTGGAGAQVPITVTFVTPGADPVNTPDATPGSHAQNQFTYSLARPGILRIELRARVDPAGNAVQAMRRVHFEVDDIPRSRKRWEGNRRGRPTRINGDFVETSVTFTGLPRLNRHFGIKKARLFLDGALVEEREYMVFFPRDGRNHPGSPRRAPNWFYYWKQVAVDVSANYRFAIYDGAGNGTSDAEVKGMTEWNYRTRRSKTRLYVHDSVVASGSAYGVGKLLSGIDCFIGTLIHEWMHTDQIRRADQLVPHVRCWRFGYSWNRPVHNHWRSGRPDGRWGHPPIRTHEVNIQPPFQIGQGADQDIDHPAHDHWPDTWPLPASMTGLHPIEQEAVNHSDNNINENQYARQDWADPGKNHLTRDVWDD